MNVFFDQMERKVQLKPSPQRIVSLVPSITEFLFALGLEDRVVGITKFCIFPDKWFRTKTKIGGTKSPDIQKIKTLQPDLIIGNK
jgi:ABC-type Fe3+-hydroxamate transport system substrate-binding protein